MKLKPAENRTSPLGGDFVSRIASTTSKEKNRENHGFTSSSTKGAGIRVYEYASKETIVNCRIQLEYLFWLCNDSIEKCVEFGISEEEAIQRKEYNAKRAQENKLDSKEKLLESRMINDNNYTNNSYAHKNPI